MAGIVWARHALVPEMFCWILIIILATRLLIGLRRPSGILGNYLILPLFFLIGGAHTTPFLNPPESNKHIYHQINSPQDVVLVGRLAKAVEKRGDKSRIFIEAEQLYLENDIIPSSGKVLLTMSGSPPDEISPGDMIIAKARLSHPRNFGVPGVFDYASYLANQKIWVTGWLSSPYLINKITEIPASNLYKRARFLPERIRQKISNYIDEILPNSTAGIYKAILIGDRAGILPELTENYKTAGNIHLLAISGLHIGLLAFFLGATTVWVLKRSETMLLKWSVWKTAAIVSAAPLAGYAFIAGSHTPVLRAIIMTYIFMGALVWNRQGSIFNNLALAAIIILTINPSDLFAASFQLSFAAVGSIALIFPKISALFNVSRERGAKTARSENSYQQKIKAFCLASILISAAASVGTAPLLAYHFNRIPVFSPISTLLVEPLLCFWSLLLGLLACLFIQVPGIATGLFQMGALGIQAANFITKFLAQLPFGCIWLPTPTLAMIVFYYGFIFSILFGLTRQKTLKTFLQNKQPWQLIIIFTTILLVFIIPIIGTGHKQHTAHSTISVLDVGQGLAVVVELPKNKTFIIDAGKQQAGDTIRFNVGRDLIAPFLWKKKISKVTAIILSHPDSDHANGIPFLVEHFQPEAIWTNGSAMEAIELYQVREIAQKLEIPIMVPAINEEIYADETISLRAISTLHKDGKAQNEGETTDTAKNNKSLVLKLTIGTTMGLFAGDIEEEAEQQLVESGTDLRSDILVAPHHGSKTSSSENFIRKVAADFVVISAGPDRRDIFPSADRIERYKESGGSILSTAISGSIFFRIADQIEVNTFY